MQKAFNKINNIQLADFRERTRTYKFLIILAVTIFCASFILPPINDDGAAFRLSLGESYRAIYNSAFVGAVSSVLLVIMLSLFGFYLVRGSIEHDEHTGIGQIVAAAPISKMIYLLGKLLSNFFMLIVIVGITTLIIIITFFIRGEVFPVNLWQFLSPILIIVLPTMLLVASIALLFEVVPFLKGSFGNILYFFMWCAAIASSFSLAESKNSSKVYSDILGVTAVFNSIKKACPESGGGFNWGYNEAHNLKTVLFEGIEWKKEFIISRLLCMVLVFIILCIAMLFFNRFDVTKKVRKENSKKTVKKESKYDNMIVVNSMSFNVKKLTPVSINFSFFNIIKAEFRLMVNGLKWWWIITALGLIAACIFSPIKMVQSYILPIAWIWPIAIWSSMGNREKYYNTNQIVFSSPFGNCSQLIAIWISGMFITILTGSGMLVRLIMIGNLQALIGFIIVSMFIPSLALMLGVWSGNNKLFELSYLLLWYFGPINNIDAINFVSLLNVGTSIAKIIYYFVISMIFLLISLLGRSSCFTQS